MEGETTSKERLVSDLRVLVNDAEELLKATASQAGEKIAVARQKIEQSLVEGKKALADAEQSLFKKSKECAEIADDYVRDPEIQKLIGEAGSTMDAAKRKANYSAAIKRATEQAFWLPLHTYVNTYAFAKALEFKTYADELPRFYLAKWK